MRSVEDSLPEVERLSVVELPPRQPKRSPIATPIQTPEPETPPTPRLAFAPPEQRDPDEAVILKQAAHLLATALSVRALLFINLMGALILGIVAMIRPNWMGLAVLIAYAALTIIPLVVLELRKT